MPITRASFLRTNIVLLMLGMAALAVIVATTTWLVERSGTYFDEVVKAKEARSASIDLLSFLQDIETAQRGYLLTLNEDYLEPYTQARDEIIPQYEKVVAALEGYPQAAAVGTLRRAIDGKLAEIDGTISLTRAGEHDQAVAIVETDEGRELMDDARRLLDAVIHAADERVDAGVTDQRAVISILRWTVIGGGLVILLVVGGSVWIASRYTHDLIETQGELAELNAGLEKRVGERTQELIRANEEVQRFAYIVTHDLRAPLVNIMGFTSELNETMKSIQTYMRQDGDEPLSEQQEQEARTAALEDMPEAIGFIRSSTQKMDSLINAILKISRDGRRALKPEKIDLEKLAGDSADAVQHQVAETEGEIRLDLAVQSIVSDRLSLEQILGNLLDNAIKYRAEDRPVEISISAREAPGRLVLIEVADNGRGVAPQDHERIFDLFRRSGKQDQPGEGIGLAHVRTLVRNLGGDITLSSEYGEGTTFTIVLPRDVRTIARSMSK